MEITPLANALGAEIRGVNIITHPSDADIDEIRSIWHKHHIIVFRGIDWTPDEHMAFSRRFGDLDDHAATPNDSLEGYPELLEVTNIPKNNNCLLYTSPSPRDS